MAYLPAIPSSLREFSIPGGLVLTRPDVQGFFLLNPSATVLWNLLSLTATGPELIKEYSQACAVSTVTAEQDITAALNDWQTGPLRPLGPITPNSTSSQASFLVPREVPFANRTCLINGTTIELRYFDQELFDEIAPRLAPLIVNGLTSSVRIDVFWQNEQAVAVENGKLLAAEPNVHATRAILLQELVRSRDSSADWLTILHAGACTNGQSTILFPAATNSGKTTLMAALMGAGLAILGDDSTPITRTGHLPVKMPYAMMIREGSWPFLESCHLDWSTAPVFYRELTRVRYLPLSMQSQSAEPTPVSALVFPIFQEGSTLQLGRLECWDVLRNLRESGLWVDPNDASWAEFLSWLQTLPAYSLTYGDGAEAVRMVEYLFANPKGMALR